MPLNRLPNVVAALAAALAMPGTAAAQSGAAAHPKTEAQAARASGKATTDTPAASQVQGAAWAAKQAAEAPAAPDAARAARPAAARVVAHGDLVETMRSSGQFSAFLKALDATNLTGLLKNNPNLTVFAPTDAAFEALPPGEFDRLMADKGQLQKVLTHHVINARVDSSKIKGAKGPVPTVAGNSIELDGSGEVLKADNATIVQADVMATNGVLQVVDRVLTPGAAASGAASGRE